MAMPLKAADPYHLERVSRIARVGTLAYEPADDLKLNVLGWTYELVLADVATVPGIGTNALKLHGMLGLALFLLAIAAVLQLLGASPPLAWLLLLSVPVAFHQFVLVKNDLFGAIPGLVVLAWIVTRLSRAAPLEVAWATWLAGIAVGMKLTSFPLVLVAGGAILVACRRDRHSIAAAVAGLACGLIAGGLLFTLVENHRVVRRCGRTVSIAREQDDERAGSVRIDRAIRAEPVRSRGLDSDLVARPGWLGCDLRAAVCLGPIVMGVRTPPERGAADAPGDGRLFPGLRRGLSGCRPRASAGPGAGSCLLSRWQP